MIMSAKQISEKFGISYRVVTEAFAAKGSPAFKKGFQPKSPWCCDDEKFEQFMVEKAAKYKGTT